MHTCVRYSRRSGTCGAPWNPVFHARIRPIIITGTGNFRGAYAPRLDEKFIATECMSSYICVYIPYLYLVKMRHMLAVWKRTAIDIKLTGTAASVFYKTSRRVHGVLLCRTKTTRRGLGVSYRARSTRYTMRCHNRHVTWILIYRYLRRLFYISHWRHMWIRNYLCKYLLMTSKFLDEEMRVCENQIKMNNTYSQ